MRLAVLILVACSEPARSPPIANKAPLVVPAAPACAKLASSHRVTLERGRETQISRDGRGLFKGSSLDHFSDGTSTTMLTLELFGRLWLPDDRDRAYHPFGDHCVRLVSRTADRVELEVALQAAHAYDARRCEMGCCPPGGSRAPDGSEECCFCSDAP